MNIRTSIIFSVVIALLLLIAQTGYWYNHYIVNPTQFKSTFYSAVRNDESRQALANEIVDRGLQNRPILMRFFGETAQSAVYSLLGTDFFQSRMDTLIDAAHERVTAEQSQNLSIDLRELKAIALPILERINPEGERMVEARQIPDQIILIKQEDVPTIAPYTKTILFLGWLSFLALIPITLYYFIKNNDLPQALKVLGATLAAVFLFFLIAVVSVQPVLLANIPSSNIRVIAENVLQAFLSTYNRQLLIITIGGLIVFLIAALAPLTLSRLRKADFSLGKIRPPHTKGK